MTNKSQILQKMHSHLGKFASTSYPGKFFALQILVNAVRL